MPSSYSGNPAGLAATDTLTITDPNDGELANVASILTSIKKLADYGQFVLNAAGFLGVARSWSALQTFAAGLTASGLATLNAGALLHRTNDDDEPLYWDQNPSTSFKLLTRWGTSSGSQGMGRLYLDGFKGLIVTQNALWVPGTPGWVRDNAGSNSYKIALSNGTVQVQGQNTASWSDASWLTGTAGLTGDVGFRGRNAPRFVGTIAPGGPTVSQSFGGVGTPTYPSADVLRVPLGIGVGTTAYTVMVCPIGQYVPKVVTKNASYFEVEVWIPNTNTKVNPLSGFGFDIDFAVYLPA
jgi:hypothetical protein